MCFASRWWSITIFLMGTFRVCQWSGSHSWKSLNRKLHCTKPEYLVDKLLPNEHLINKFFISKYYSQFANSSELYEHSSGTAEVIGKQNLQQRRGQETQNSKKYLEMRGLRHKLTCLSTCPSPLISRYFYSDIFSLSQEELARCNVKAPSIWDFQASRKS